MRIEWPDKDPNEVVDYLLDWSRYLAVGEKLQTVTWTINGYGAFEEELPPALTKGVEGKTDTTATIWLQDGTVGVKYRIGCRAVTDGGRTLDATATLRVRQK